MNDWKTTSTWISQLNAQAELRKSNFNGGELHWRVWGSGEPLLLLHGGSGSWTHWCRNIEFLSQHYQLFIPDLPGCGDSDHPGQEFDRNNLYQSTLMLARIVREGWTELSSGLASSSYRLMGFSLGSIVATVLARIDQDRVTQLGLIGTSALGIPFGGLSGQLRPLRLTVDFEQRLKDQQHNLALIMLADCATIDSGAGWLQLHNVARARLRTHWLANSDVVAQALPAVTCPVYALWGQQDVYSHPDFQRRVKKLKTLSPAAIVCVIDQGGHWIMYELASEFNAKVLALLREQSTI